MLSEPRNDVKCVKNNFYAPVDDDGKLHHFSTEAVDKVFHFQQTHPNYTQTPLLSLENLADHLDVGRIHVKDESERFGLNAFKVMGGIYAIGKYIADKLDRDIAHLSFQELQSTDVKETLGDMTFISATDGNHGKGVAWAAKELGQSAVIYMPKGSAETRLQAIRDEGATAVMTDVNYDETVRMCTELATENDWVMVQDTAWEGYEQIPLWVMQGYASIAREIVDELETRDAEPPTHVILQAGVGSFAAGITAYFCQYYGAADIKIAIVEPDQADCYYRSFADNNGMIQPVTGDMDSIMAGLCCGEPNTWAFQIMKHYAYAFYSCSDRIAALGMRVLGNPLGSDEKIIAGESGAVPLGLLYYLRTSREQAGLAEMGLDEASRVLIINTEGNTDPDHYLDVVWGGRYANG